MPREKIILIAAAALHPALALAHTGAAPAADFAAGLAHPFYGLDHVLAMTAVGLWAALIGGRALWAWPAAFLAVMVAGALLGLCGVALPGAEAALALSVIALGAAAAARLRPSLIGGALVCGLFALFHGQAQGAELPAQAGALAYVLGFVAATALLHAAGLAGGLGLARLGLWAPRLGGAAVAATGVALLVG
jgi:urease accessory protein